MIHWVNIFVLKLVLTQTWASLNDSLGKYICVETSTDSKRSEFK